MLRKMKAGSTSQSVPLFVQDTTSTTGAGLGSLVFNSSGLVAKYRRQGQSSWTTITLQTMTLGTWASGGFIADGGGVTGGYELGLPDAVLAAGVEWVEVQIYGATNMLPVLVFIELDVTNYQDGVRMGMTALPNAAAEAAGGLFTRGTGAGQINQDANGRIDVSMKALLGTTLTEGSSGRLKAAFTTFFDVATPVLTTACVNQTGDGYAIVNHASYGNAQLVRSTVPANTLDVSATGEAGLDFNNIKDASAGHTLTNITIPTVTTLTNDPTGVTTLLSRLSASRAGYLDNLNVGGAVASQADVQAVNQSASKHLLIQTVGQYERPESGNTVYTVEARTFSALTGAAVNADSTPTLAVVGQTSGDLSANLSAASNPATGVYRWTYTVSSAATIEPVRFDVSATIASSAFTLSTYTQVVDLVSATWTSTDASRLTAIYNKLPANNIADETLVLAAIANVQSDTDNIQTRLPTSLVGGRMDSSVGSYPGNTAQTGDAFARLGAPAGGSNAADVAAVKSELDAVKAKTDNLPASPAAVSDIPTAAQVADKVIGRNIKGSTDGGRTVGEALAASRNRVVRTGNSLTVYDTDDVTPLWTAVITTDATAQLLTSVDPA